jgi:hypothetical protein
MQIKIGRREAKYHGRGYILFGTQGSWHLGGRKMYLGHGAMPIVPNTLSGAILARYSPKSNITSIRSLASPT